MVVKKMQYSAPVIVETELANESVICSSYNPNGGEPGPTPGIGDEFNF